MDELTKLKSNMVTAAKILLWELSDMWGHVSCKAPDGKSFFILPLRPPADPSIPDDDVLEYDFEGNLISGQRDEPEEIFFYTCTYDAKKDVGAVIHVHPLVATSVVATGRQIIPMHHRSLKFMKGVPVTPWLYGVWREDGEQVAKVMGDNCAVMINGHGANVTGKTLQEACLNTVELERTAKMMVWAASVGKIKPFVSSSTLKKYQSLQAARSGRRPDGPSRSAAWSYFEAMVKRNERWNTW